MFLFIKKMVAIIAGFLINGIATAQQPARIDTDRPDQTESALVIPQKYFQAEFGFGKENSKEKNYTLIHPTALLKYGVHKRVELRLVATFFSAYARQIPNTKKITGVEPIEIGTKISLFDERGILPQTALIIHVGLPFASTHPNQQQKFFPSFRFTMQNSITDNFAIGYNLGAAWNGYTNRPEWLYTFSPNFNIGRKWYAYAEIFGFINSDAPNFHNVDAGIAYYISNNLKIDLSSGAGLSSSGLKNYIALGFSFRLPVFKQASCRSSPAVDYLYLK